MLLFILYFLLFIIIINFQFLFLKIVNKYHNYIVTAIPLLIINLYRLKYVILELVELKKKQQQ